MKRIVVLVAVWLVAGAFSLSGAPLDVVKSVSWRPESCPGAEFKTGKGTYSVKLDKKTGSFGKWTATYCLPSGFNGCRFQVRHNAGMDAVAKSLIVCTVNWLDGKGNILRSSAMEADKNGVFHSTLRRPEGAETAEIAMGVRYYSREVTFSDVVCEPVSVPVRKVRIVATKIMPASYGKASCEDNQNRMEYVLKELERVGEKPDLVIFPETLLTRWVKNLGIGKGAQPIPGPHTHWAGKWAKKLNTNIVVSLRELKDGAIYNSAAVIDRTGKVVGVYRKTQLTIGEYGNGYDWGTELPVFDLDFGRIGVLICWDMWFPEAVRTLRLKGAEVIAYPIAGTGRSHFDWMWRTRAMENGLVLAASISGGDTCPARIITASGELLSETYYPQTYAAATVDLDEWRSRKPCQTEESGFFNIQGRHPELYRGLSDLNGVYEQGKK